MRPPRLGRRSRQAVLYLLPRLAHVVGERQELHRGSELEPELRHRFLWYLAEQLRRGQLDLLLLEDLVARQLQPGQVGEVRTRALALVEPGRQLVAQPRERRMRRRMRCQVLLGHLVEALVAQQRRQLGEVVAEGVDLPPDEHVRVDPDALLRAQLVGADEDLARVALRRRTSRELPEQLLALGEFHGAALRKPSTSASTAAAWRLCATSSSSSGMRSSHSISVGTRPNRCTACR